MIITYRATDAVALELLDPASLSIEDRLCDAFDALVGADEFDPVDDWLCAASNVFRVAGDSCEPVLDPETGAELAEPAFRFQTDRPR